MKRRDFIKVSSLTVPAAVAGAQALTVAAPTYRYLEPKQLEDVITKEGDVLVRLKFSSTDNQSMTAVAGRINVTHADVVAITTHNFESVDDIFDSTNAEFRLRTHEKNADIFLVRLRNANSNTQLSIDPLAQFLLTDILKTGYLQFENGAGRLDVNFLLDHEIGEIQLSEIGVNENPDTFSFHIFADPQGGDPSSLANHPTRMKIHNAFIEDSIILSNHMPQRPLFSLILGDIVDSQGEQENFKAMHEFWQNLDSLILYELGNHESRYSSKFEPGYDMSAFQNYFTAQKKINAMEKILYSFNVGQWHFVVWPDPLRSYFWDNHPHYFEWLESDLKKYKHRPTMFFQHVPIHPMGINPFQGYLDAVNVRKKLLDLLTKHGNVKYVISGHVHAPVKSSLKTACRINGTNFITLPAAGFRPRGFGEEDFFGGPSQGIAIVNIRGNQAEVIFKTVMEEELIYQQELPEMDLELYKLWFHEKWEIQADSKIVNGNFSKGLSGWIPEYVYNEDENPSVICEPRKIDNRSALYLYNRIRGYQAPGQDRLPQTINRISHIINFQNRKNPVLQFDYKLDQQNCDLNGRCGGYVWIEGYEKSFRQFNLVYSAGQAYVSPIAKWTDRNHDIHHFALPNHFDWSKVSLNLKNDFESVEKNRKFDDLNIDRIVITLGVWTLNEGTPQPFAMYFTDFALHAHTASVYQSTVNDEQIQLKSENEIWWRGKHIPFIHLAGEHRYHLETAQETLFKKEHERHRK